MTECCFSVCCSQSPVELLLWLEPDVALSGQCSTQKNRIMRTTRLLKINDSRLFSCEETEDTERSMSNVRGY